MFVQKTNLNTKKNINLVSRELHEITQPYLTDRCARMCARARTKIVYEGHFFYKLNRTNDRRIFGQTYHELGNNFNNLNCQTGIFLDPDFYLYLTRLTYASFDDQLKYKSDFISSISHEIFDYLTTAFPSLCSEQLMLLLQEKIPTCRSITTNEYWNETKFKRQDFYYYCKQNDHFYGPYSEFSVDDEIQKHIFQKPKMNIEVIEFNKMFEVSDIIFKIIFHINQCYWDFKFNQ